MNKKLIIVLVAILVVEQAIQVSAWNPIEAILDLAGKIIKAPRDFVQCLSEAAKGDGQDGGGKDNGGGGKDNGGGGKDNDGGGKDNGGGGKGKGGKGKGGKGKGGKDNDGKDNGGKDKDSD